MTHLSKLLRNLIVKVAKGYLLLVVDKDQALWLDCCKYFCTLFQIIEPTDEKSVIEMTNNLLGNTDVRVAFPQIFLLTIVNKKDPMRQLLIFHTSATTESLLSSLAPTSSSVLRIEKGGKEGILEVLRCIPFLTAIELKHARRFPGVTFMDSL